MDKALETMKALVKRNQQSNESMKETTSSMDNPMNADWVWGQMADIWGEQWIRERGELPSNMWITNLSQITEQHIKRGVARTISERLTWPPSLPQFLSLCLDFDTTEAYNRMIDRKPAIDDVEYYTRVDVSYRCKKQQMPDAQARKLFDKVFKIKLELKRKGKLPIRDQKLLSTKSVVSEACKEITNRVNGDTWAEKRMAKAMANRKNKHT